VVKLVELVQSNGNPVFVNPDYIGFIRPFTVQPGQTTSTKTIVRLRDGQTLYLQDTMRDIYYLLVANNDNANEVVIVDNK
jgi:hypothetical protein